MKDKLTIEGKGHFEIRDSNTGEVLDSWDCHNTMVTAGFVEVAKLICGDSSTYFRAIAIGTGTTGAVVGNTTLETEYDRQAATLAYAATGKATFEHLFVFGSGVSETITEAGVFNNSTSGGEMLDRFTFTGKAVDADKDLYVFIEVTVA